MAASPSLDTAPQITAQPNINPLHKINEGLKNTVHNTVQKVHHRLPVQRNSITQFPQHLDIELTNVCNLRCVMCPRNDMTRKLGFMPPEVFKRIVDEMAIHHATEPMEGVWLHLYGESILHPQFIELTRYMRDKIPTLPYIGMSTNCTYLDEKHCNILFESGLTRLVLSIDGATKETYEKIRVRGDFEEVTENARRFLQMRDERGAEFPRVRMQIIRMKETEAEIEQFRQQWQPLLRPTDVMYIKKFTDFGGQVDDRGVRQQWSEWKNMSFNLPTACGLTYFALAIHYNGDVVACCFDVHGEMKLGNVMDKSLEEIWHGPELRDIREAHLARQLEKYPLCAKCDELSRDVALGDLMKEDVRRLKRQLRTITLRRA